MKTLYVTLMPKIDISNILLEKQKRHFWVFSLSLSKGACKVLLYCTIYNVHKLSKVLFAPTRPLI